MEGTAVKPIN